MVKIRTWYTYATDVLGYMNPKFKLVLGITRESTCRKLEEVDKFLICPKDTTRHKIKNFKTIYHPLYERKSEIVLPNNYFYINSCGKIVYSFILEPKSEEDINLLKALGPFIPWTIKHILEYASGKKVYQKNMKFGTIAIFILKVFKLENSFKYYREVKPRVSNQYFNVDGVNILKNCAPIIPNDKFNEILYSIKYIHSEYLVLNENNKNHQFNKM